MNRERERLPDMYTQLVINSTIVDYVIIATSR